MIVALVPMCFTACGGDDDADATGVAGVETLYGVWQQTHRVAWEDGAWHHDNDVSTEDAEYLYFKNDGRCSVHGGIYGVFGRNSNGTYSFNFDADTKILRVGSRSITVEVLSGGTLKLKYHGWEHAEGDYTLVTYKKVESSVWDNL